MAGTDSSKASALSADAGGGPAIVLVNPQLGENIGMAARAMLNCGLTDLRLVNPRAGWRADKTWKASSGADRVLEGAQLFQSTADAVADLERIYAATARGRHATQRVVTPRQAALETRKVEVAGARTGVLFGPEAKGLKNDDVALADAVLMVPLNPAFKSLNLAQAVFVVGYEWYLAGAGASASKMMIPKETRPATKEELLGLFAHLERELDDCGFLRVREKRPRMVRNLRNLFQRAGLTEQEVRTLRGVIACLVEGREKRR
ncbi:MAG: RNA methyltransferase [Rhodospirillales bacterium]|nr:RNA methyltransferase [Rhodospirillales bacterium]